MSQEVHQSHVATARAKMFSPAVLIFSRTPPNNSDSSHFKKRKEKIEKIRKKIGNRVASPRGAAHRFFRFFTVAGAGRCRSASPSDQFRRAGGAFCWFVGGLSPALGAAQSIDQGARSSPVLPSHGPLKMLAGRIGSGKLAASSLSMSSPDQTIKLRLGTQRHSGRDSGAQSSWVPRVSPPSAGIPLWPPCFF